MYIISADFINDGQLFIIIVAFIVCRTCNCCHHSLDADSRLGISFQRTFYTVQSLIQLTQQRLSQHNSQPVARLYDQICIPSEPKPRELHGTATVCGNLQSID